MNEIDALEIDLLIEDIEHMKTDMSLLSDQLSTLAEQLHFIGKHISKRYYDMIAKGQKNYGTND
jgi:hypothetical protein